MIFFPFLLSSSTRISQSALYEHLKLHGNVRPFACRFCPKRFHRKSHARGHEMHVHTKERRWKCTRCEMAFPLRYELTRHWKSKHDKDPKNLLPQSLNLGFESAQQWRQLQHPSMQQDIECQNLSAGSDISLPPPPPQQQLLSPQPPPLPNSVSSIQIVPLTGVEHSYVRVAPLLTAHQPDLEEDLTTTSDVVTHD